jgi:hypothetical protein
MDFLLLGFIDAKTLFIILHIFGAILGAGSAFLTDAMYFTVVKDKIITDSELRFIKLGSTMVWGGIFLIIISGLLLFSLDPEVYLNSNKFLAKMTIVGILVINGLVFHFEHLRTCAEHIGEHLPSSKVWRSKSIILYASGAISVVSWISTIILGVFRGVPYNYSTIMLVYLLVLAVALLVAMVARVNFLNSPVKTGKK